MLCMGLIDSYKVQPIIGQVLSDYLVGDAGEQPRIYEKMILNIGERKILFETFYKAKGTMFGFNLCRTEKDFP